MESYFKEVIIVRPSYVNNGNICIGKTIYFIESAPWVNIAEPFVLKLFLNFFPQLIFFGALTHSSPNLSGFILRTLSSSRSQKDNHVSSTLLRWWQPPFALFLSACSMMTKIKHVNPSRPQRVIALTFANIGKSAHSTNLHKYRSQPVSTNTCVCIKCRNTKTLLMWKMNIYIRLEIKHDFDKLWVSVQLSEKLQKNA